MRGTVISALTLAALLVTVILLSLYTHSTLTRVKDEIEAYEIRSDSFDRIAEDFSVMEESFLQNEPLLRLIVSDNSLLEIHNLFSDIVSYAAAENMEGVLASRGRLSVGLEHLINLSSISLISIF